MIAATKEIKTNAVTVTIEVTQAQAIRAGVPKWGTFAVEVDPSRLSTEEREALVHWETHNGPSYYHSSAVPTEQSVVVALHAWLQATATAKARREEQEREMHKRAIEQALTCELVYRQWSDAWQTVPMIDSGIASAKELSDPRLEQIQARLVEAQAEADKRNTQLAEQKQLAEEKKRQEAEQEAEDLQRWLIEQVETYGTASQRERMAAGVLPLAEIQREARNRVFQVVTAPRFQKMNEKSFGCGSGALLDDPSWTVKDIDDWPPEAWETLRKLSAELAGWNPEMTLRKHKGRATAYDYETVKCCKLGILVVIQDGPVRHTREFSIG